MRPQLQPEVKVEEKKNEDEENKMYLMERKGSEQEEIIHAGEVWRGREREQSEVVGRREESRVGKNKIKHT